VKLGATAVFSSGEGPADGSVAKLGYLTVSTYVRDAGKRMSTDGIYGFVDGIQIDINAKTMTRRNALTSRVRQLFQGVAISTGATPEVLGLQLVSVVPFDNEALESDTTYHRNSLRFEQRSYMAGQ
jgi:hypothetical protein